MIATNLLLNAAFCLVTNFAGVVSMPDFAVPHGPQDLRSYVVGSPYSPIDLYLTSKSGLEFWIRDGAVYRFRSPLSFFQAQDPSQIARLSGVPALSSNQVLALAKATLQTLLPRGGDPPGGPPKIQLGGFYQGQRIPFYRVVWPSTSPGGASQAASVEVDARTGKIPYLQVFDPAYYDLRLAQQISNSVFIPEPQIKTAATPPGKPVLQHPTTNYLNEAIRSWLAFCEKLGIDPGADKTTDNVNWEKTWLYTNAALSTTFPVCQVWFTNGACFEAFDGAVFSSFSADSCYIGVWTTKSHEHFDRFRGTVTRQWKDLAANFQRALIARLGIPEAALSTFTPSPRFQPPEIGSESVARAVIEWRNWPKNANRTVWTDETRTAFSAEFDLQSGALKWADIRDPKLIKILSKVGSQQP